MRLIDIIRRHRKGFIFAISLVVIEKLAWIVEPTLFGRLLDALIGPKGRIPRACPWMNEAAAIRYNI